MAQFFSTVGDFITTVYRYITHLVQGILSLPSLFMRISETVGFFESYIPVEIAAFIALIIMVCLLFHIIGR